MSGTYLLLPLAFILTGLLPNLLWNRRAEVDFSVYLLGWLAWFCSVSVKYLISSAQLLLWPAFFTDPAVLVINNTVLETIEVISAYMFLKYHPALKDVRDWKSIVAFGLGFGGGEAITLGVTYFSTPPVGFSLEFLVGSVFLAGVVERLAAMGIHLASAAFLAFFLIDQKTSNFIMGLLSKDLSATIAGLFIVLSSLSESLFSGAIIELVFVVYAVFWIAIMLYVRKKQEIPEELPERSTRPINSVNVLTAAIVFFVSFYLWSQVIGPALTWPVLLSLVAVIVLFFMVTVVAYLILGTTKGASTTEILAAGAAALTVCVGAHSVLTGSEGGTISLTSAMIPFFGILCAAGVCALLTPSRHHAATT